MGRPSIKTPELLESICHEIMEGKSLREVCSADEMPNASTVTRWLAADEEFCTQYARACEARTEHWADEILEIADNATNDWMERQRNDGSKDVVVDREHISRSQVRIEARKWLMSKMAPKKYGTKVQADLNVSGTLELAERLERGRKRAAEVVLLNEHAA